MDSILSQEPLGNPPAPPADRKRGIAIPRRLGKAKKPRKPRKNFPLTSHPNGQWSKKIRKRVFYFGPWSDPVAAEKRYNEIRADLEAGRTPRPRGDDRLTMLGLSNEFLTVKKHHVQTGELSQRSFNDYFATCERLLSILGKTTVVEELRPDDLLRVREHLAKTRPSVAGLGSEIGRARVVLNFAYKQSLIDRPIRFGDSFRKPGKAAIRKAKGQRELARGKQLFAAAEIRGLIDIADVHLRAMTLLAINTGCGNADCGRLVFQALDLDGGWLNYPRPKTGVQRRCKLWPETVAAIQASIVARRQPKAPEHVSLVFVTRALLPWFKENSSCNPVSQAFRKLLIAAGIHRKGIGFYTLRHVFETVAGQTRDQVAVNACMGHVDDSMSAEYREEIDDARLQAVSDHVRTWLFAELATVAGDAGQASRDGEALLTEPR